MCNVSVIIPNYNHSKYLKKRIDSVLNQSYKDFEVIILDDFSTDNSTEIIDEYKSHPKISHIVINTQNSGSTFKQWSKGLALTKGKYLWIAESDDVAENDFLEVTVPFLEKDAAISYVATNVNLINSESQIIRKGYGYKCYEPEKGKSYKIFNGNDFVSNYLIELNYISNASAVLLRKKYMIEIPSDYTEYSMCGDMLFWMLMSLKGKVALVSSIHSNFRHHPKTVRATTNTDLIVFEYLKLTEAIISKLNLKILRKIKSYNMRFKYMSTLLGNNYSKIYKLYETGSFSNDPLITFRLLYLKGVYHPIRYSFFLLKTVFRKLT